MDKPFLNYEEQINHLVEDKKINCDNPKAKELLIRNGYFNLINGYKTPFVCNIDKEKGKHIYYPGTKIEQISLVKEFDDDLRIHLLKYITKAEEEVRTIAGYKFDDSSMGISQWNDKTSYADYQNNETNILAMINSATDEINRSELDYIKFYIQKHNMIPSWIFVKIINFSTFINFLECSNDDLKDSICNLYNIYDLNGKPNHKLLIGSLHWLRKVRNSCAHNERIYTIERKNGRIKDQYIMSMKKAYQRERNQKLIDLLVYLKYYLDVNSYSDLIYYIKDWLTNMEKSLNPNVFANIRGATGIKEINDLQFLLLNPNIKDYENY